jgi:MSHA biogenesis protein MshN
MSLINQVLNDLESRGASVPPILDEAIRPVIIEKKQFHSYWLVGLGLVFALVAGAWLATRLLNKPVAIHASPEIENSLMAEPAAALVLAPEKRVEEKSAPASRLSSELSVSKKSARLGEKNTGQMVQAGHLPLAEQKGSTRSEPAAPTGKQLKKTTPQQQAENEFHKATLLVQQGQLKDAASGYEAALLLDPLYDKAREALVAVLLSNKANAEAEKVLQDGLALNEKQTRFAMLLARLQVERKALPQALQTLEKSLPYAGQQADYHAFIAALLQRQDRHAEAISQYQAALQLSPNSGVWLMGMAISLQALKRDEEARVSYKRAIETHSLSTALQSFVEQRLADLK